MTNPIPWWSLSHRYMWQPLYAWLFAWILLCVPGLVTIGKIIRELYRDRRDRKLLLSGAISMNEYRQRKGIDT